MNSESDQWCARVEYIMDKVTKVVPITWVKDNESGLWPSFDPLRCYRVFWSSINDDCPVLMLERAPVIPELTEDEEKRCLPGYYRANILGIEDDEKKFENVRQVINPQREGNSYGHIVRNTRSGRVGSAENGKQVVTRTRNSKSDSSSSSKPKPTTKISAAALKKDIVKKRSKAIEKNVGVLAEKDPFTELDSALNDGDDFGSDDSNEDESLVSEAEMKVLKATVKKLRLKLVEKCAEISSLTETLASKDDELTDLRRLNRKYQDNLFDLLSKPPVCPSPATKALSDLSSPSYELTKKRPLASSPASLLAMPAAKRMRSDNLTIGNCTGIRSPVLNSESSVSVNSDTSVPMEVNDSYGDLGIRPLHASPLSDINSGPDTISLASLPSTSTAVKRISDNSRRIRSPLLPRFNETCVPEASETRVGKETDASGGNIGNRDASGAVLRELQIPTEQRQGAVAVVVPSQDEQTGQENATPQNGAELTTFTGGHRVNKEHLHKVECYNLSKENDAKFVKDMAVVVFSIEVLHNSSVTGQQCRNRKDHEKRPALDSALLKEIQRRLQARVEKELRMNSREQTPADWERYSAKTVNYYIKEKIKKLRGSNALRS